MGSTQAIRIIFKQYYFLLGVMSVIAIAELFPWVGSQEGPLHTRITVNYLAVSFIFFTSGYNIQYADLVLAFKLFKIHLFIQVFTFIFTPPFVRLFLFIFVFPFGLDSWIMTGVVAVSCLPPPVSSTIVIIKAARGNEAVAIFNLVFGCFLGIFVTPILLLSHVGLSSTLPMAKTILTLGTTILIPLFCGQIANKFMSKRLLGWRLDDLSQFALLFIIYTSFCDMFMEKDFAIDAKHVLATLGIVVTLQLLLTYLSMQIAIIVGGRNKSFRTEDIIAIVFCSTHKSLTLGLPLLKTLYGGYSHLSQISLPLLMYHPVQLILGALFVPFAQKCITRLTKSRRLLTLP